MDRGLKRAIEIADRDCILIVKATAQKRLHDLIASLRPVPMKAPLIRLGPLGDGGYLIPDDLEGISACISPGVSTECGFDLDLAGREIEIIMADASVDGPPILHPKFHFHKKFLETFSSERTLTASELISYIPQHAAAGDLLLQMDIESAEYRVFYSIPQQIMQKFRIIVAEFHSLSALLDERCFELMAPVFEKILRTHSVVHIHPNNAAKVVARGSAAIPDALEFTFYRRDRIVPSEQPPVIPHPLDRDNVKEKPPLRLPGCWLSA